MDRKITMKDVALEAGVSTATVGRVLHQRGYVSESTRASVLRAIQKTGFRLNLVAQSLRRNRSMTIGHLVTSFVPNPFFAGIETGVEQEAIRHGYNVLLWNVLLDPKREREGVETFIRRRLDAIIFTTPQDPQNVILAKQAGIPVIQVERPTHVESHLILIDNYVGSAAATEHLIQLGHERIAYVGRKMGTIVRPQDIVDQQRLAGWRETLTRHGITPLQEWFDEGDLYSIEDGCRSTEKFLSLQPNITAIIASCDMLASGVLQAVYQRDMRVPEDISVIGFDDTYAPFLAPPLTTVRQPMFEIGVEAARLAIEILENPEKYQSQYQTRYLETRLEIRASTGVPHRYFPA